MKKALSMLLALCMALTLCIPVFASGEPSGEPMSAEPVGNYAGQWTQDAGTDAWCLTDVAYCQSPAAAGQMNIFVPGAYMDATGTLTAKVVNGYNAATAPIVYLVNDGAPAALEDAAAFLSQGYVVAALGTQGGDTLAALADVKAGVRFLKSNDVAMAGDASCVVAIGTGAAGALTALLGTTGDDPAYDAYLTGIGAAAEVSDAVYACQVYSPALTSHISQAAYDRLPEQVGAAIAAYIVENYSVTVSGMSPYTYIDEAAADAYIAELNAGGEWVGIEYTYAKASTGPSTIVTYADGCVCTVSGLDAVQAYTGYGMAYSGGVSNELLDPVTRVAMGDTADYFRIRVGTADENGLNGQSLDLAMALETNSDATVDYALAWGQPHGDAEINADDLFAWIERVCKFERELTDEQIASVLDLDNMEYTWTLSGEGDRAYYMLSPIVEVAKPEMAAYQGLSVAIPAYYVKGMNADGSLEFDYDYQFTNPNGVTYTAATAPIIINTGAAGYSAGTTGRAGGSYVSYGYINVACGNRGKSLSTVNAAGEKYYCGDAPYCLVDQKSCVRWLKYNIALGNVCGDADRMVSTGGSGGGAHSMMLAATGNNPDFYPYLEESGAVMRYTDAFGNVVEISDAIWGACPYSAITNLEEANMAYEFEGGLAKDDSIITRYSPFRQILSQGEAEEYMYYINGLNLTYDINGDGVREALTIEYDAATDTWSGTYIELMEQVAEEQLEWYINHIPDDEYEWAYSFPGERNGEAYLKGDYIAKASGEMSGEPSGETEGYASEADDSVKTGTGKDLTEWVTYWVNENGEFEVDFDVADFMVYRGRSKTNPSFDDLDLGQAENQVFGDFDQDFKHWDIHVLNAFDAYYDELAAAYDGEASSYATFDEMYAAYKADIQSMQAGDKFGNNIVRLYNPMNYILDPRTELPAWVHNCHGSADTDSSVLISMNDGIALDMMGVNSFFAWSWDDPHVAGNPVGTTMPGYIDAMVMAGY